MNISMYDCDTPLGMSNGVYNKEREEWLKEHCAKITSRKAMSPRGDWFAYASIYNGYIYAIGDEQGNYAGGDLVSVEYSGKKAVEEYIKEMPRHNGYEQDLYEKIKNMPIATKEMVDEMNKKLKSFD